MKEILLKQQRITDSLNEIDFSYDIDNIHKILEYKHALDNIYNELLNKLQTYTVIEGYHTKIKLLVKPKAKINSLRKFMCKEIEEEEGEPPKPKKAKRFSIE